MKARIENGTVVEILNLDPFPPFHPSLVWVDCDDSVECGDRYDGEFKKVVINQTQIVPQSVSRFQARVALSQAGYFNTINSYMNSLPIDDIQRLAWNDAMEFRRNSPTVSAMAVMLNLTNEQLDDLFILANSVSA